MKFLLPAALGLATVALSTWACTPGTAPSASPTPAPQASASPSLTPSPSAPAAMRVEVKIKGFAFDPPVVQVKAGGVVVFTNLDSAGHTATPDQAGFTATKLLAQNESAEVAFTTAGSFAYHCAPHPNMKGSVEVLP